MYTLDDYKNIDSRCRELLLNNRRNMISRCYSPKDKMYRLYGQKGIKVCKEWLESKEAFVIWAMNNGYKAHLTIERADTDKDYCPSNCSFIPNSQQPLNTSRNRFLLYKGEVIHISEVARRENVSPEAIRKRIKRGWYLEVPNPNKGLS